MPLYRRDPRWLVDHQKETSLFCHFIFRTTTDPKSNTPQTRPVTRCLFLGGKPASRRYVKAKLTMPRHRLNGMAHGLGPETDEKHPNAKKQLGLEKRQKRRSKGQVIFKNKSSPIKVNFPPSSPNASPKCPPVTDASGGRRAVCELVLSIRIHAIYNPGVM